MTPAQATELINHWWVIATIAGWIIAGIGVAWTLFRALGTIRADVVSLANDAADARAAAHLAAHNNDEDAHSAAFAKERREVFGMFIQIKASLAGLEAKTEALSERVGRVQETVNDLVERVASLEATMNEDRKENADQWPRRRASDPPDSEEHMNRADGGVRYRGRQ